MVDHTVDTEGCAFVWSDGPYRNSRCNGSAAMHIRHKSYDHDFVPPAPSSAQATLADFPPHERVTIPSAEFDRLRAIEQRIIEWRDKCASENDVNPVRGGWNEWIIEQLGHVLNGDEADAE